jgi:hypothetical protein
MLKSEGLESKSQASNKETGRGGLIEKLHIISVDRTLAYRLIKKERHAPLAPKLPPTYIEENNKLINLNKSNKSTCENFEKKNLGKDYPKPTIIQDMLRIWNEELGREDSMIRSLVPWLMEAFKKFQRSLDNWRSYLRRIKTSTYLMGSKFKVYLKWALSFRVVDCILRGGFGRGAEFSWTHWTIVNETSHLPFRDCLGINRIFLR